MTASGASETWIYGRLWTDAPLRALVGDKIFAVAAPESVTPPYVIYWLHTPAPDVLTHDGHRVLSQLTYEVVGVDQGDTYRRIEPIAQRIDLALHLQRQDSGSIIRCVRTYEVSLAEVENDVRTRYRGGLYRCSVESANPI